MKILIDEEKFAYTLLQKEKCKEMDNEEFIKENLLLYLETVVAISKFNKMEEQQYQKMKEHDIKEIISGILNSRINP